MTDYIKATGSGGTMMIRDLGSAIEFWIKAGSTGTYAYNMNWSYTVNGSTSVRQSRYEAGGAWLKLNTWAVSVTTNQTITFKLESTGTSGLGGPTTFTQAITRTVAHAPPPPTSLGADTFTTSSARYRFSGNGDGGSPIIRWQVGYGTNQTTPLTIIDSSGTSNISGLSPSTTYYFWSRGQNAVGYGGWSARSQGTTLSAAPTATVPSAPGIDVDSITETSARIIVRASTYDGGKPVDAYRATVYLNGSSVATANGGTFTASNLTPGTSYTYTADAHNAIGWSQAGPTQQFTTLGSQSGGGGGDPGGGGGYPGGSAPSAPTANALTNITQTSMTFSISGGDGDTTAYYQMSTTKSFKNITAETLPNDDSVDLTGLLPGTTYYFRAYLSNSYGDSSFSATVSAATLAGALIKVDGVWKLAIPYVKDAGVWKPVIPYLKTNGEWKVPG